MIKYLVPVALLMATSCGSDAPTNENSKEEVKPENKVDTVEVKVVEEIAPASKEIEAPQKANLTIEDFIKFNSRDALGEALGDDNLKDDTAWYAEGTVAIPCTYYRSAENDRELKFLWNESGTLDAVECHAHIYDQDYNVIQGQKIDSRCGIYSGMTLKDLVEWNGEDFEFAGFGWDYQGNIMSPSGKLSECKVNVRLGIEMDKYQDLDNKYLGDITLSTTDEGILDAPIIIEEMTYYITE